MDGSCDNKIINVASTPRRLSGPLRVVELGGQMDDKFDACAQQWNLHSNCPRIIRHANRKLTNNIWGWVFIPLEVFGELVQIMTDTWSEYDYIKQLHNMTMTYKKEKHAGRNCQPSLETKRPEVQECLIQGLNWKKVFFFSFFLFFFLDPRYWNANIDQFWNISVFQHC